MTSKSLLSNSFMNTNEILQLIKITLAKVYELEAKWIDQHASDYDDTHILSLIEKLKNEYGKIIQKLEKTVNLNSLSIEEFKESLKDVESNIEDLLKLKEAVESIGITAERVTIYEIMSIMRRKIGPTLDSFIKMIKNFVPDPMDRDWNAFYGMSTHLGSFNDESLLGSYVLMTVNCNFSSPDRAPYIYRDVKFEKWVAYEKGIYTLKVRITGVGDKPELARVAYPLRVDVTDLLDNENYIIDEPSEESDGLFFFSNVINNFSVGFYLDFGADLCRYTEVTLKLTSNRSFSAKRPIEIGMRVTYQRKVYAIGAYKRLVLSGYVPKAQIITSNVEPTLPVQLVYLLSPIVPGLEKLLNGIPSYIQHTMESQLPALEMNILATLDRVRALEQSVVTKREVTYKVDVTTEKEVKGMVLLSRNPELLIIQHIDICDGKHTGSTELFEKYQSLFTPLQLKKRLDPKEMIGPYYAYYDEQDADVSTIGPINVTATWEDGFGPCALYIRNFYLLPETVNILVESKGSGENRVQGQFYQVNHDGSRDKKSGLYPRYGYIQRDWTKHGSKNQVETKPKRMWISGYGIRVSESFGDNDFHNFNDNVQSIEVIHNHMELINATQYILVPGHIAVPSNQTISLRMTKGKDVKNVEMTQQTVTVGAVSTIGYISDLVEWGNDDIEMVEPVSLKVAKDRKWHKFVPRDNQTPSFNMCTWEGDMKKNGNLSLEEASITNNLSFWYNSELTEEEAKHGDYWKETACTPFLEGKLTRDWTGGSISPWFTDERIKTFMFIPYDVGVNTVIYYTDYRDDVNWHSDIKRDVPPDMKTLSAIMLGISPTLQPPTPGSEDTYVMETEIFDRIIIRNKMSKNPLKLGIEAQNATVTELVAPVGTLTHTKITAMSANYMIGLLDALARDQALKESLRTIETRVDYVERNVAELYRVVKEIADTMVKSSGGGTLGIGGILQTVGAVVGPFLPLVGLSLQLSGLLLDSSDMFSQGDVLGGTMQLVAIAGMGAYGLRKLSRRLLKKSLSILPEGKEIPRVPLAIKSKRHLSLPRVVKWTKAEPIEHRTSEMARWYLGLPQLPPRTVIVPIKMSYTTGGAARMRNGVMRANYADDDDDLDPNNVILKYEYEVFCPGRFSVPSPSDKQVRRGIVSYTVANHEQTWKLEKDDSNHFKTYWNDILLVLRNFSAGDQGNTTMVSHPIFSEMVTVLSEIRGDQYLLTNEDLVLVCDTSVLKDQDGVEFDRLVALLIANRDKIRE